MFNIKTDISLSELENYIAPNALPESTKKEPMFSKEYARKVMRYLRNSALPILHRIEHKIITLFAKGEWINNNAVMRRLEAQVARLSNELMHRSEKGKVSFADTDRIRDVVRQMKAICQKLAEAGFEQTNIDRLNSAFEVILNTTVEADKEITERNIQKHVDYASSHKVRKSASDILAPKVPSVSTKKDSGDAQIASIVSSSSSKSTAASIHSSVSVAPVVEPVLTPVSERKLISNLVGAMNTFFIRTEKRGVLRVDFDLGVAFKQMDAEEAVEKADRILTVVERTLVKEKMAKWKEKAGGDIVVSDKYPDIDDAYFDLVQAYSDLKSFSENQKA